LNLIIIGGLRDWSQVLMACMCWATHVLQW